MELQKRKTSSEAMKGLEGSHSRGAGACGEVDHGTRL